MKNKFMITVSDIHGVKQYTLHQFIKVFILWIITAVLIVFTIGTLVLRSLDSKVEDLDRQKEKLQKIQKALELKNMMLEKEIDKKGNMLSSMNEHLSEIEKMIGLEPTIESAFINRAEHAKEKLEEKIRQKSFTVAQLTVLNHSIPNGAPLKYKRITDRYGYRIHPILHKEHFHVGIDLSAKFGTPIYAPADGVVEFAQYKGSYGNFLLLCHPFGFKTAYGHLSKFEVHEGEFVSKGDVIGYVGTTGRSTGSHLHYEVRYLTKWLDPEKFMKWSSKSYTSIMRKESQVDWVALMQQIEKRLQLYNLDKLNKTKISK